MTMLPSLFFWVRMALRVKASRNASLPGDGRVTVGPSRKRVSGVVAISEWIERLYSCSTQACVASLRKASLRSGTCSSMAMSRPSTGPQNASCFAFW